MRLALKSGPATALLFDSNPDPVIVFDEETLQIVEANSAAVALYGYTPEEWQDLTILDIRPGEDVARAAPVARSRLDGVEQVGRWRHLTKSGDILHVDIRSVRVTVAGRRLKIAHVRDLTPDIRRHDAQDAMAAEAAAQLAALESTRRSLAATLAALRCPVAVLAPDDWRVLSVTDMLLACMALPRDRVEGQGLFDHLGPDAASTGDAARLRAMLTAVAASGEGAGARFAVNPLAAAGSGAPPGAAGGWQAAVTPVRGADGAVELLVLRLDEGAPASSHGMPADARALTDALRVGEHTNARAQADILAAQAEAVRELLPVGFWSLDPETRRLNLPQPLPGGPFPALDVYPATLDDYLAIVHPEDRDALRARFESVLADGAQDMSYECRVLAAGDRTVMHRASARLCGDGPGRVLAGAVLDVTAQRHEEDRSRAASELARLAGETALFGGWRIDPAAQRCEWTPECARILDLDGVQSVGLLEVSRFFQGSDTRDRIREAYLRCLEAGEGFDLSARAITAKGRRIWVRVVGSAERDAGGQVVAIRGAFQDISDREQARVAQARQAERLALTLEQMGDGFLLLDRAQRLRYVNAEAARHFHWNRDNVLSRVIWVVLPSDAGSELRVAFERAVAERVSLHLETRLPDRPNWLRIRLHPVSEGLAVYFRDITADKRRSDHLRLLEAAIGQQHDVLIITDATPVSAGGPLVIYANPALERVTGHPVASVIGKPIPFAVSGEPMTEAAALIRMAIEDGVAATGAVRARRHDGSTFWMEVDVSSIRDATGAVANSIVVFHDITDRRAALDALRTSEERFRLVTNATSDVVWDWDVQGGRCWYSSGMTTVFGHSVAPSERIPTVWQEHLHPDDAMAVLQSMEDLISGANESWSGTYRFRRGDGTWATVNDRAFVVRDASGRALRVVGSMTDATERLALEDQLRQAQKLEAVGQLTGGIAHDFNNLLTIIIGSAEILADTVKDPSRRWMVDAVMDAAERGAALVARLIAFARRQPLAPVPLDLGSALMQLESMLRRTIPNTIEIRMSLAPDLAIVSIDPNQFDNAILNLCVNARDAMPSGGTLIIETANTRLDEDYARRNPGVEPGEYVAVSVSDSGSGMPKDVLARAFEPFFSTKASGKGTGMGLSMVFGFVKQSRGHIKLYSEPGQGTTVRLYFPHDHAAALRDDVRSADTPTRWQGNEHVLMVEDDPAVRKHVAELLTSFGYRVTAAGSGPEALAALDELPEVALLFTDVVLPGGLNGRELADQALAQRPDLRVLFTSGYTRNVMLNDGRLGPGFDLLSKPYRRTELAAKVREVLDRPVP